MQPFWTDSLVKKAIEQFPGTDWARLAARAVYGAPAYFNAESCRLAVEYLRELPEYQPACTCYKDSNGTLRCKVHSPGGRLA